MLPPLRSFLASDRTIREILRDSRSIALIGIDSDPSTATFRVGRALQSHGYRVLPVHCATNAREILGEPVSGSFDDLGEPVDLIVVLQRDADLDRIATTAHERGTRVLWLQPGVGDPAAAYAAHRRGMLVVMNRCIAKEYEAQFPEDELL
ncbi:MAG: CoA-binding protein [Planctomycetes bacterium]|nr:CoA-binding protein [Planctomycetota bacterium]MCC7171276.1 CoA-binding protein [Planctomycetota bacterium]